MTDNLRPTTVIDKNDPGDETLKRFRYQITYSCIASLTILQTETVEAIYCEHFEDVLVEMKTGKFVGIQVKTKSLTLGGFDCQDEAMIDSITKFIKLKTRFPVTFERFVIVTNNDFSKVKPAIDLAIFVKTCKDGNGHILLTPRSKSKTWVQNLSKKCKCSDKDVLDTLSMVELKPYSSIDDIRKGLISELRVLTRLADFTYGKLEALADQLILVHFNASSLQLEDGNNYHILQLNPSEESDKNIIENKKITKEILNRIIERAVVNPVSLFIKDNIPIDDIPRGYQTLEIKMDAGQISSDNIILFKDNKYSVENLMATWLYKDIDQAEAKYQQIRLIVNNECQVVYDEMILAGSGAFGTEMLIEVRKNLKKRYQDDPASFYDLKIEHLFGMAGILTEECKVWWSTKFEIN